MALPLFGITLFVSAFILFLVQPMIGKLILPKLGGTPQVWNTCMLFFQTTLLAGYAYTHTVSTRAPLRRQLLIHSILLFVPLIILFGMGTPFNVEGFETPGGQNPIYYTLGYLAIIVGLPFFVVSTSAPLLQKWFAGTGHEAAEDPYFLYAASNFGSLLALLAYPFIVEPWIPLSAQTWVWAAGYLLLIAMVIACASMVWNTPQAAAMAVADLPVNPPVEVPQAPPTQQITAIKPAPAIGTGRGKFRKKGRHHLPEAARSATIPDVVTARPDIVDWKRRLRWILLAFVPSSLMLGVITFVSTDLSPFPLLWVAPLTLYLLSFILVYLRWKTVWVEGPHSIITFFFPIFILILAYISLGGGFHPYLTTISSFLLFFGVALFCHGELARDRPPTRYLTDYYLCMSFGGMLGGLFNGLFAPIIFNWVAEYPIVLVVACLMRPTAAAGGWSDRWLADTFPSLDAWVRDKGDNLARSFGKTPTHSLYLLGYLLDILYCLLLLALTVYLKSRSIDWNWSSGLRAGTLEAFKANPLFRFWTAMGTGNPFAAKLAGYTYNALVYGIPMAFCFFFAHRPLRFALGVGAFLFATLVWLQREENYLFAGRSYFGVLRVFEQRDYIGDQPFVQEHLRKLGEEYDEKVKNAASNSEKQKLLEQHKEQQKKLVSARYTSMMHGTTLHGQNYFDPPYLKRVATTYYHRLGPVGVVMEKYNWFFGDQVTSGSFLADYRMPAALVGIGPGNVGVGNLPLEMLAHTWSEPPYATVGLGTGTMASYARPFQHMTYYEIDQTVRNFSLPPSERFMRDGQPFFTYLSGALDRGVNLEIIMGDARQTMQKELNHPANFFEYKDKTYGNLYPKREKYYKVMVIDAFSSDAIPVHLLTYEAVKLYSEKLADDGVLCIHTSNRHLDLVKPGVDIAVKLGMQFRYGNDHSERELGHSGSNYLMLAWHEKYLNFPKAEGSKSAVYRNNKVEWIEPRASGDYLWTDDYSNIVSVIR